MTYTPLVPLPPDPSLSPAATPSPPSPPASNPSQPPPALHPAGAVLHDSLPLARTATDAGFTVASTATRLGFAIAQTSMSLTSSSLKHAGALLSSAGVGGAAGPALVASGLSIDLANSAVGVAQDLTLAAQHAGQIAAQTGISALEFTTEVAGYQNGDGVRLFVSEDDIEAARFVHAMVVNFLDEVPAGITAKDMYAALSVLALLHADTKTGLPSSTPGLAPISTQDVSPDVQAYIRPAVGIYGNLPTAFLQIRPSDPSHPAHPPAPHPLDEDAAITAFCRIASVPPSDVLAHDLKGATYQPGYIVYVDRPRRNVVVTLRGTINFPADVLTDLVCGVSHYTPPALPAPTDPHPGAHGGMLEAARRIRSKVESTVATALADNTGFNVMVTGHSLGAGVATLLGSMWGPSFPAVKVVAFAPPCTLTRESAAACTWITSVVCGTDVVSRFGLATSVDLREVLWLDTDPSGVSPPAAVYEAPNDTFDHIALQPGMYRSHMPQFYLKQVESLAS
ncbi:hypothetical protein TeGR_g4281 [Tetraparma gracilis]|uniref:sn-1-specific diacylglycerol lipase n=1 Tax=Tetraparma gracilis TaxID=2962635 RepID=A0ABQ6N853_9STRA|nr:hypothetical protein TeGR_g4281 [Tetraparma gracilis]